MNPFADLARPVIDRPGMFVKGPPRGPRLKPTPETRPDHIPPPNPWGLTAAQCEALRRVCEGQSSQEISQAMGVSVKAIEAYLRIAREKMNCKNRIHTAVMWDRFMRGVQIESPAP